MELIHRQRRVSQENGLFRAVTAWQVLWELLWPSQGGLPESLPPVAKVDVFISHSWSCSSRMKYLTLCHYLNFVPALVSSSCTAACAILLLFLRAGSVEQIAQEGGLRLSFALFHCPMAVFLLVYFAGHLFDRRSFWFDRLCVNQNDAPTKAMTLQAIPAFVAQSQHVVVLWDRTFFEKLWCIYEIAISAKTAQDLHQSGQKQHFAATWVPIVTVATLALFTLGAMATASFSSEPLTDDVYASQSSLFMAYFMQNFPDVVAELINSVLMAALIAEKLQQHQVMLDQVSRFNLRNAKCSLETDRLVIESQVINLFDEALEAPLSMSFGAEVAETAAADPLISPDSLQQIRHLTSYPTREEVLEEFNAYVRGCLKEIMLQSIGGADEFPPKLYLVFVLLPILLGLVRVFGCDGHADCQTAALYIGCSSVWQYWLTNAFIWFVIAPTFSVLSIPIYFRVNHAISKVVIGSSSRLFFGTVCSTLLQFCQDVVYAAVCGTLVVAVTKSSYIWLAGFLAGFTLIVVLLLQVLGCGLTLWQTQFSCRCQRMMPG